MQLDRVRKGLWHLLQGGIKQSVRWIRRRRYYQFVTTPLVVKNVDHSFNVSKYPSVLTVDRPKSFPGLKVGVILDEFLLRAWSQEFETGADDHLKPSAWFVDNS